MTQPLSRRQLLVAAPALAFARPSAPAKSSVGIAITSLGHHKRRAGTLTALPFIELCQSLGGAGVQMDIGQLASTDAAYLKRVRADIEQRGMFFELAVPAKIFDDAELLEKSAATASALGVTIFRVACLSGRRYEDFHDKKTWDAFIGHWKTAIPKSEAALRRHKLEVGIENHKDWLADELADVLGKIASPHLGACVDFGNNLSLMEDPLDTAEKLARFTITTHLKDLAVVPTEDGFDLGDIPLGEGVVPMARIVELTRKHRPDVHFCLEVMTRDALKVPYKTDGYWVTFGGRKDPKAVKAFEAKFIKPRKPLPKISAMTPEMALATEADYIRKCIAYARKNLKL